MQFPTFLRPETCKRSQRLVTESSIPGYRVQVFVHWCPHCQQLMPKCLVLLPVVETWYYYRICMGWRKSDWMSWFGMLCKSFALYIVSTKRERDKIEDIPDMFFLEMFLQTFLAVGRTQAVPFGTAIATAWCDFFAFWGCELRHRTSALYRARVVRHGPWDTWPICQIWWEKSKSCFFLGRLHAKLSGCVFCSFLCLHHRNPVNVRPSPLGGQVLGARHQHSWGYWALGGCG